MNRQQRPRGQTANLNTITHLGTGGQARVDSEEPTHNEFIIFPLKNLLINRIQQW